MSLHDHEPLVTIKSVHNDGDLALYTNGINGHTIHLDLGDEIVTTSDVDLVPLAKAILNAVEPEALAENQKDAEPEPESHQFKIGDWVKVAADAPYNENFRGQTLQVASPGYSAFGGLRLKGAAGYVGAVNDTWVTPASEPTPEPERDLAAEVDTLTARVTVLEAAADTEIRVGDTVRVEPDDWNIGGTWVNHEVKTGTVAWVADENYGGRSKYLVSVTDHDGYTNSVYALKATKVGSRG